ncbi:MAG: carbohydrate ABC transporter permease [Treponema sp.]|nr:carbohydrate ABC transporter permease [Treponema sp.]
MMKEKLSFKKEMIGRTIFVLFDYLFLILIMVAMIVPLLKLLVSSIDPSAVGLRLIPRKFSLEAYGLIAKNSYLYLPFLVSVGTTLSGTLIGLLMTSLAAYVIMQRQMPGNKFFVRMVFLTMLFSGGLIPTYLTIRGIGLMNNYLAVILPVGLNAYNIMLMKSFFETIPRTLFEAAEIDGCSPVGIFFKIVLPLSKPAIASVGLFIAVSLWNNYMSFILYITNPLMTNFQVKVRELILSDAISGQALTASDDMLKSAVVMVVVLPFLMIYPWLQKYFVKGVTLGAVKS